MTPNQAPPRALSAQRSKKSRRIGADFRGQATEGAITVHAPHIRHDRPAHRRVHDGLHPFVYRCIIALTIWLVLSIWTFFNHGGYVGLTLTMITVFFLIAVGIPVLIWKTWQHNAPANETRPPKESFETWASQSFATWTGAVSGHEAAMQILLPIAAVSIGMFVFGLVFYVAGPHAGY